MESNDTHKINQIIDMLDTMAERIDDIEKVLISNDSNNGVAEKTDDDWLGEENWVCQVCGKSTFESENENLVHPQLHLGCSINEEHPTPAIPPTSQESPKPEMGEPK